MDNYLGPWIVICINALIACLLNEVAEIRMPEENLQHWDTVSQSISQSESHTKCFINNMRFFLYFFHFHIHSI
jgi:hypothetical protein